MSKTYITATLSALCILISLSSCGTTQQLVSERRPSEIKELTVVKPITNIEIVESGNRGTYSKLETDNATANIFDALGKTIPTDIKIQNLKIRKINAETALTYGLINYMVDSGTAYEKAIE